MKELENLNLSLIEGTFSDEDAKEILLKIYGAKLSFHQKKNLSSQERFGKNNTTSDQRIPILQKSIEEIKAFTEVAKLNNLKINISSNITLELKNED